MKGLHHVKIWESFLGTVQGMRFGCLASWRWPDCYEHRERTQIVVHMVDERLDLKVAILNLIYVYGCFACMYICVPYEVWCPQSWIPWSWS